MFVLSKAHLSTWIFAILFYLQGSVFPFKVYAKAKERSAWFAELARGKALHKLVKNVPRIKRQEEVLEYLCDYRVPPFRALWYLKVTAVLNESLSGAKQQDSVCDIFCSEYRNLLLKSIKGLVAQMLEVDDLSASSLYKDRWLYISNLSKCAFEEIIKTGEVDYRHPVMEQLKSKNETADTVTSSEFEELTPDEFADHKQEEKSERAFLNDAILINHRILIQMPLRQDEEHRNEANQRALLLYGMGDARENHILEMKKIAREICKIWQKKIYVRFECDKAPLWKQSVSAQRVSDTLKLFKSQTYYDQAVICGWCAESFSEMIHDFVQGNSLKMPTPEGLDILCGMFETAQNIFGIFEMCAAITPLLPYVEKVIRSLVADVIPGSMSGQLGYVFLAYMSRHWLYFLHSGIAPTITNQLYRVIEPMIRAYDYPMTSWGRTIAAFVYHSKKQLKKSKVVYFHPEILESSQIVDLTNCAHKHLILVLETIQRVICEEDWVTVKMFKIAETKRMEAFNYERLKQNCLGQQLLRLGLRRKSERDVISELNSCSENSKIELIRKLLTSLNMWNMRATLFELMLMVKEVSPESAAEGDALMSELARCSLDLFSKAKKEDLQLFSLK
ncbi:transcription mediator subunit Med12, partial [Oesophagostomum dentatum]